MNLYRIYQSKKDKVIYVVILLMKKTKIPYRPILIWCTYYCVNIKRVPRLSI